MVSCSANGCSNRGEKGYSMKAFPRDPEIRRKWQENVNRTGWQPTDNSKLCEVHFLPEMWEKPRVDGKKKLKWNAVPTIFPRRDKMIKERTEKIEPVYFVLANLFDSTESVDNADSTCNMQTIDEIDDPLISSTSTEMKEPHTTFHPNSFVSQYTEATLSSNIFLNIENPAPSPPPPPPSAIQPQVTAPLVTAPSVVSTPAPILTPTPKTPRPVSPPPKTPRPVSPPPKTPRPVSPPPKTPRPVSPTPKPSVSKSPRPKSPPPKTSRPITPLPSLPPSIITITSPRTPRTPQTPPPETTESTSPRNNRSIQVNYESIIKMNTPVDSSVFSESFVSDVNIPSTLNNADLFKKIYHYQKSYTQLLAKVNNYKDQIKTLKIKNERLVKIAKKDRHLRLLKYCFNDDQICALERSNKNKFMKWTQATLINALRLKNYCGTDGYEEILRQKIPLPSIRTLNRIKATDPTHHIITMRKIST